MKTTTIDRPVDFTREVITKMAEETLKSFAARGIRAFVNFKFTCPHCGERCTLEEPNTLYEKGECYVCGKISTIDKAGYILLITRN